MKILVGMSGGIDSSYTAMRLIGEGHDVEGAVLVMDDHTDVESARMCAEKLGIPINVIDCRADFDRVVRANFVSEYLRGRTPNPCVICNPKIKFLKLYEHACANGFDKIATGHYARVVERSKNGRVYKHIAIAEDKSKDQSYMLYRLPANIIEMLCLPMGEEFKKEIRETVKSSQYAEFDKKDSQEICFIPDGDYASYIEEARGKVPHGNFIDRDGRVLGEHKGIIRYTVGQRKGLGISLGERVFVTRIDPQSNTVTLDTEPHMSCSFTLDDVVFTADDTLTEDSFLDLLVKVRYSSKLTQARVYKDKKGRITVKLASPQRSVTPGQSCVLYEGDTVIGGGIISEVD